VPPLPTGRQARCHQSDAPFSECFFSGGETGHRFGMVMNCLPTAEFVTVTSRRRGRAEYPIERLEAHHVVEYG
jgi:hypothetical protein